MTRVFNPCERRSIETTAEIQHGLQTRVTRTGPVPHSPPIQLVAIDLDGTLLNDSKQVSDQTIAALACAAGKGVRVVIASARPPRTVRHIYQLLQLQTWQINYNGAMIWDEPNRRTVRHYPIEPAVARAVMEHARRLHPDVLVSCEVQDRWLTDRIDHAYTTETGRLFKPDQIADIAHMCHEPVTKVLLLGPPTMMSELLPVLIDAHPQIHAVQSDPDLIQLMDLAASKAAALQEVAAHYGVPMDSVMAIGDAANDVPMLRIAGVSIAMDNAAEEVRRAAHWIAPSNNDHGVHAALRRYGLCD